MRKLFILFILLFLCHTVNSQTVKVFNIDSSAFPIMRANFYAFDASWNQQRPNKSEIAVKENGLQRNVLGVGCSTPTQPKALSSILVIDISGSMNGKNFAIAKAFSSAWINTPPNDKSECAITSFDKFNYFNRDFSTDKNKLLKALNNINAGAGTDYNKALLNPMCGGLVASKTGKYQKVIILITDGLPSSFTEITKIIAEAKSQSCMVFCITLNMPCPKDLKDIAIQTGGDWYEKITDESKAIEISGFILNKAQGAEPCTLTWRSEANCDTADINLDVLWNNVEGSIIYHTPLAEVHKLLVNQKKIIFGHFINQIPKDTIVNIKAVGVDYKISAIKLKYGTSNFEIKNLTYPFIIPKNTNFNIPVRYSPADSNLCYAAFEIVSDYCPVSFSCIGGYSNKPMKNTTLKLTKPNGKEIFTTGIDTTITWDGVAASELINLEYSIDKGKSWRRMTNDATGLKYIWKNMPKPISNQCMVRVIQGYENVIPKIEWQKSLGGSKKDFATSIEQTRDGGYIVAGETQSKDGDVIWYRNNTDFWVVKLNSFGHIEWRSTFGGDKSDKNPLIKQTYDDGFIIAGSTYSNDGDITNPKGDCDVWVAKLSSMGTVEWQNNLGGSKADSASGIELTSDGGYIMSGTTSSTNGDVTENKGISDIWIVKINSLGAIEWQKSYGGSNTDFSVDIKQTNDGGYIVAGNTSSSDGDVTDHKAGIDWWIFKINAVGKIEWQKSLGGSKNDKSSSIQITKDDGYIATGFTNSTDGDIEYRTGTDDDGWIVKLDKTGIIEWQKTLGGTKNDYLNEIHETKDNGYIIAGKTESKDGDIIGNHGYTDGWIIRLNSFRNILWQKPLGGSQEDAATNLKITSDSGYIVAGSSYSRNGDATKNNGDSDFWVIKLSPEGNPIQLDKSDDVFSIVASIPEANDVDMKQCLFGSTKDSIVNDVIKNLGNFSFTVDSIYFQGKDAGAFSLVSDFQKYTVPKSTNHNAEIRFIPIRAGKHQAELVIITQGDTLIKAITGEGIQPELVNLSDMINFGKLQVGKTKDTSKIIIMKYLGAKPLTITETKVNGPNQTDFYITSGGGSITLETDDVIMLDMRFKPSDVGRTSGVLEFYYNGVGSPAQVQLYGEGLLESTQDLATPVNDSINLPIDCVLNWKQNFPNCSYELQIAKDENFSQIAIDTTISDTMFKCFKLGFIHTYHWRVRAVAGSEQSNWSPLWKFTTLMDKVKLTTPENMSKNIHITWILNWEKGIHNSSYKLLLSTEKDFKDIDENNPINNEPDNFAVYANLKLFTTYYWKVRNKSGDTLGYWSKTWQFKTRMQELGLIYPKNGYTVSDSSVNFKWSKIDTALYYILQISKNNQFTDLVYSNDSITTTEHSVPDFEPGMRYYWRVRGWNQESIDWDNWSEVWAFITGNSSVSDGATGISIVPNPAGDFITINLDRCLTFGVSSLRCWTSGDIQIYNTLGEKVMTVETLHATSLQINISALPRGVYFVRMGGETAKFVKL